MITSIKNYFFFIFVVTTFLGCSRKLTHAITINGESYLSVDVFGVKGDGVSDDRKAIQKAIESGYNLYFPEGTYLLASKTNYQACLVINNDHCTRKMFFEQKSLIKVSKDFPQDFRKVKVFWIVAQHKSIKSIEIEGLHIDGKEQRNNLEMLGLLFQERKDRFIESVKLKNITVENVGFSSVDTQALNNKFENIITKNSGKHGVVASHQNKNAIHKLELVGLKSTQDNDYSLNLSGPKDRAGNLLLQYPWVGSVTDVVSIDSGHGIKVAGDWSVSISDVQVHNSKSSGFKINHAMPHNKITLKNAVIKNTKYYGLNLRAESSFTANNIIIDSCVGSILVKETLCNFDSLFVSGFNKSENGISLNSKFCSINKFEINNMPSTVKYALLVNTKNADIKNGKIENNNSIYGVGIESNANKVNLENIHFESSKSMNGVFISNQSKNIRINNCNFSKINGEKIVGRNDIKHK